MKYYKLPTILIMLMLLSSFSFAQENSSSNSSLKVGFGLGINDGERETGFGTLYSFGYQKSFFNNRIRVSPYLMNGGFTSIGITDTRDQFYRTTSLGINGDLDIVKFKSLSLIVGAGAFANFSRGLLGTGGELDQDRGSEYFYKMYYGVNAGTGLRIDPKSSRFAFELKPINVYVGTNYFILGFMQMNFDFKMNASKP